MRRTPRRGVHILGACHILCVCHYTQRMPEVKSRRELYSEATRAALLDEATTLFAERGYAGTSLEDVASASQVTRGAVYHHFASKQALFEAVLELQEARVTAEVTRRRGRAGPVGRGDARARRVPARTAATRSTAAWSGWRARPRSAGTAGGSARRTTPTGWSSASSGTWSTAATWRHRLRQPGPVLLLDARRRRAGRGRGAAAGQAPGAGRMALPHRPGHQLAAGQVRRRGRLRPATTTRARSSDSTGAGGGEGSGQQPQHAPAHLIAPAPAAGKAQASNHNTRPLI